MADENTGLEVRDIDTWGGSDNTGGTSTPTNTGGGSGGGGGRGINYNLLQGMVNQGISLNTQGTGQSLPEYTGAQDAAVAANQILNNSGYDFNNPLREVELPNRVAVPERQPLPDNFDFNAAYNDKNVNVGRIDHIDTTEQQNMLNQLTDLQRQQAELQANRAVETGTVNLQRAMQDAQKQFETQRNQISMDEQRALDNQVLYSEARGDRGGIGQAQYNTIQNTAATNRLTVQKEQTQLATDTARQIADLRSQGEFEKANQLLAISQQYLSQLMDLYQWAQETNLGIDEFNLQVAQWEENFKLQLVNAELDAGAFNLSVAKTRMDQENNIFNALYNQENSLFDARLNALKFLVDQQNANLNAQLNVANATGAFPNGTPTAAARQFAQELLAQMGLGLVKEGQIPSALELQAMGIPVNENGTGVVGGGVGTVQAWLANMGYSDAESALRAMGVANSGLAGIRAMGLTYEQALANILGLSTDLIGTQTGVTPGTTPGITPGINPGTTSGTTQVSPDLASWLSINGYASATDALRAFGYGNEGLAALALYGYTPESFLTQVLTEGGIISPTTQTPSTNTPTVTPTFSEDGTPDISGITNYDQALALAQALEQQGVDVDTINATIDRMIEQLQQQAQLPSNPYTNNTTNQTPSNPYNGINTGVNQTTAAYQQQYEQALAEYQRQYEQALREYEQGVNDYVAQLQAQLALRQLGLG